jgi:hypothetical protein
MENVIITTTGDVIDTEQVDTAKYRDVLLGLKMLRHAKLTGWSLAEANDLYRGLKMLKVGLPFNLGDNASKALIIDYLKNYSDDMPQYGGDDLYHRDHLTLSDGFITHGLPYIFTIPFTGEEGKVRAEELTRHVSAKIRFKVVGLVKEKTSQDESSIAATVDAMFSFNDTYVNNVDSDTFSPLGVSVYSFDSSTSVMFCVMDILSFGVSQTPEAYRKLFQAAHEVLHQLQTAPQTENKISEN